MGTERNAGCQPRPNIICLEGNGSRPSHFGDGFRVGGDMYTLNTTEVHAVCYGISPYTSNAMKSKNPCSGIYIAETARTLDISGGNPTCNQGGVLVVEKQNESGADCAAYGLITKGNGEVILSKEKHTSLSVGGGQAGQGYPAVWLKTNVIPINTMVATRENDEKRTTFGVGEHGDPQFTISAAHEHAVAVVSAVDCRNGTENECVNGTLQAKTGSGFTLNSNCVVRVKMR